MRQGTESILLVVDQQVVRKKAFARLIAAYKVAGNVLICSSDEPTSVRAGAIATGLVWGHTELCVRHT